MNSSKTSKLPVFPLGLVVLPGTIQTLQIFEPRYLSMVKNCMTTNTGFVITLSKNNQSGESFMSQGTFVEIIDFNQLPNGLLGITVKGSQKVSIKSVEQLESGEIDLEKSVKLYEKGMLLKKNCEEKLKKVEMQIKKIKIDNNKIKKEDFS